MLKLVAHNHRTLETNPYNVQVWRQEDGAWEFTAENFWVDSEGRVEELAGLFGCEYEIREH